MIQPRLAAIHLHPIKSLDPVAVDQVAIAPNGSLENDRSFALFDSDGEIINAKSTPVIHRLHANFDLDAQRVAFAGSEFQLEHDRDAIGKWLSEFFDRSVELRQHTGLSFVDDTAAPGPTLISTATLEEVASWFDELSVDEIRRRLRTNLEIDGVPAFWEDRLYGPTEGELVRFRVGEVELLGKNACQRCPVPRRDVETGVSTPGFTKTFTEQRKATLPGWAHEARFDHFYRIAVNTLPGAIENNAQLAVGDALEIVGDAHLNDSTQ